MTINARTISGILTGTSFIAFSACSTGAGTAPVAKTDPAINVTVANPAVAGQQGLSISGQVESSQTVTISTRIMGYITMLKVKAGDHVSKGQLLVTISNQDILARRAQTDAMMAEAQAAVNSVQKDVDRFTALYKQQSATAKELDNVELQYNAAKSRLEAARQMRNEVIANLGYSNITAPFTGIVTQKLAEAGSMANPGAPLLTIEQTGTFQVSATVPENMISQVQQGAPAMVTIKAASKTFKTSVTQINPSSQFTGGQYIIKAGIPANEKPGVYAGMYATVFIPLKTPLIISSNENAVLVPVSSIEHKDQLTGLYTIGSNNTALLRWVRLGKTYGDQIEVLSGLEKNESFIASAEGRLYNGAPVKVGK